MATALQHSKEPIQKAPQKAKRLCLKSWSEAQSYFKEHLTPVRCGPKGQPLYDLKEIEALNVELPEDYW